MTLSTPYPLLIIHSLTVERQTDRQTDRQRLRETETETETETERDRNRDRDEDRNRETVRERVGGREEEGGSENTPLSSRSTRLSAKAFPANG